MFLCKGTLKELKVQFKLNISRMFDKTNQGMFSLCIVQHK